MKSFKVRVNIANRAFDDCFENWDGDAVVTALVRMCETDGILKHRIAIAWRGVFPQSWLDTAKKYEAWATSDLSKLAKKLRDEEQKKAQERQAEWLAKEELV
jgi:hypothetical protein